jgi:dTDP-4-dehydrorhamnose reductase
VDGVVAELRSSGAAQAEGSSILCPTWSRTIANALLQVLRQNRTGVMNFSAGGQCTPVEAARVIASVVKPDANVSQVERKIGGEANLTAYGLLDTSTYQGWSGSVAPLWADDLRTYLSGLH